MKRVLFVVLCAALAGGCGERDQVKTAANAAARDTPPWKGAQNPYVTPGWRAGDQGAWETQLRQRARYQNEYLKAN